MDIGVHCEIDPGASLDGDYSIGDFTEIRKMTTISGNVTIGDDVLIGEGVKISGNTTIGDLCVIEAGAVIKDSRVPEGSIVGRFSMLKHVDMTSARCVPRGLCVLKDQNYSGSGLLRYLTVVMWYYINRMALERALRLEDSS